MNSKCHHLLIDEEFKSLCPIYSKETTSKAEADIFLSRSIPYPIKVWKNMILTDFLCYQVCHKLSIPFEIERLSFPTRFDALLYVCETYIQTEDLTEEHERYLIGKAYLYMRSIMSDVYRGKRKFPFPESYLPILENKLIKNKTAFIASAIFHVSPTTISKYATFSIAVDEIRKKSPIVGDAILTHAFKISMENTMTLSKMSSQRIAQAYKDGSSKLSENLSDFPNKPAPKADPKIKQMPVYDKDAELESLTLTVNAWTSSLERFLRITDLSLSSSEAKTRLNTALMKLGNTANLIQFRIKETDNGQ